MTWGKALTFGGMFVVLAIAAIGLVYVVTLPLALAFVASPWYLLLYFPFAAWLVLTALIKRGVVSTSWLDH